MMIPNHQDLKYGVVYIYFDPLRRSDLMSQKSLIEETVYPFEIEWIEDADRSRNNTLLVARRFNVGNMGQCATVTLRLTHRNPLGVQHSVLQKFHEKLFEVSATDEGDIVLDEDDFGIQLISKMQVDSCSPMAAPQDNTRVEGKWKRIKKHFEELLREDAAADASVVFESKASKCERFRDDSLEKEESLEVAQLERERKAALEHIKSEIVNYIVRFHDDPQELMAELLRGKVVVGAPGRVLVNGDMKIVLPEYDEMEIKMPAMCRTLYILFMKQRKMGGDGIVLKAIDEFRDEIMDIYSMVKPGANEDIVTMSVNNLCDPLGNSLNQTISRINRCIKGVITDKELVKKYMIKGNRGGRYGIALEPECLELPRAVTA